MLSKTLIPPHLSLSTPEDYLALLKPGVMSLVVFTGWIGMLLAPGHVHPVLQMVAVLCIALGSGAGGAINMWYDRDIDAVMSRTQKRPVPAGRIEPSQALAFGIAMALLSVALMGLALNWVAASLLASAILFYVFIYTVWLKRRTPQNIVIGGAAGAFPPMIGWAAITGDISLYPCLLFLIIFLWTPPHFWALALYRNGDYAKAGVPMLPVIAGKAATKRQMVAYTLILFAVTLAPPLFGAYGYLPSRAGNGMLYTIGAALLGLRFIQHAFRVAHSEEDGPAKKMFWFSILYLFALFGLAGLDAGLFFWQFISL